MTATTPDQTPAPTPKTVALSDLIRGHIWAGPSACACGEEMPPFDHDRHLASVILAAGYTEPPSPERVAGERRWGIAVDWLLNSRHTADPDIQTPFWSYVDGYLTRDELDTFTHTDTETAMRRRKPKDDR